MKKDRRDILMTLVITSKSEEQQKEEKDKILKEMQMYRKTKKNLNGSAYMRAVSSIANKNMIKYRQKVNYQLAKLREMETMKK